MKRLAVPASFFGIILGVVGLGSCWRLASHLWGLPSSIGEAVMLSAVVIWSILIILYAGKWIWARPEAVAEFQHPILCCFIALVPISTMLISLALEPHAYRTAVGFAVAGMVGQLIFGIYRTGQLWKGGRDPATTTPVLYLPTVASNFVSAITLSAFGHPDWGVPFFGAGMLSWLAIESVILNRLYTSSEMAPPLRPTLGIQFAPSVVGCATYLSVTSGAPDMFAQGLFGYGVLQSLLMIRLLPWIFKQPFSAAYWSFTFGITAITLSSLRFVERGASGPIAAAAPYLFFAANVIIGVLALGTFWLLLRGRLIPAVTATSTKS